MENQIIPLSSAVSTSVFILTFLLVGVPLWWKTTEVYRCDVPHHECQQLLDEPIIHTIPVKLMLADQNIQQGVLWEELLHSSKEFEKAFDQPIIKFHWTMSIITNGEKKLLNQYTKISDLDAVLNRLEEDDGSNNLLRSYDELKILVLPQNYSKGPKFCLGVERYGYVLNTDSEVEHLVHNILSLVKKMTQVERLRKLYTPPSSNSQDMKPDKDRMRSLKSSVSFDITFSLIVPEPQILDVHWNIQNAIDAYMKQYLEELKIMLKINIKSQILYMTSLPLPTQLPMSDDGKEFILNSDLLPSIINPIEARLGTETSVHSNLNFVIYIPTEKQMPLQIYDPNGKPLKSNAFLLPQWGGFLIYNCLVPENTSLPYEVHLNQKAFMEVFLAQFRLLLGLPDISDLVDDTCQMLPSLTFRKWEIDFLLRKNTQEHLTAAALSLSSLSKLLQTIGNIVIKDEVGEKIYFALASSKDSFNYLSEGFLKEGFLKAKTAFISSDEAFFDPSLLALLYFPEDQKYAIYIPLFLPISIPVASSVFRLWKFYKNYKGKQKTD
ncbi:GPI transamidase component PIG-S-like [Uloborus diversus]|uniref:GPI transamidase component PIG-S-like n=1 Tax=Uloborus diversus TaxID=327109 RepID=UPI002409A334|nr:GPI transamidase component PIG-S-like [Uloborus diversus]